MSIDSSKEKFYITTAIAYTSRIPHIGNTYEAVLADAIARYKRLRGYDVFFLTGTDEHGQKIEAQAIAEGRTPQQHVDHIAGEIRRIWDFMNVSYDKFIRTTDPDHEKRVQRIFRRLYEQGDIYKGSYEGLYCVACESFFTESQSDEGNLCPDCGCKLKTASEEAYFLKLSKYADRLAKHIEDNPDFIQPESRKNEMLNNFIRPGLQDLCVSRTSFKWGIPVDFDPGHVVYVWIDALSNYITALGYDTDGEHGELFNRYWPADVHIIGKDILRFHTIYWPIILMALGVELPKTVYGHPWLLFGNDKMSKSKGNTVYASELVEKYGVDAVRYYMLREMPYGQDGNFTEEMFTRRINSDLANDLGNLLSRTVAMIERYFGGRLPEETQKEPIDDELYTLRDETVKAYNGYMDAFQMANALTETWKLISRANKYIDETTPWILGKDEAKKPRLCAVLKTLRDMLISIASMVEPHMPETAAKMRAQIGLETGVVAKGEALFPRIDTKDERKTEKSEAKAQKKEEKREQKQDKKAEAKEELPAGIITIDDFRKIQLRVGEVISCERAPGSDRLLLLKVNIGEENPRQIVSGIANWYEPESLVGRKIILVANLKPAKLRGIESQGMLLASESSDGTVRVVFAEGEPGSPVS